MFRMHRVKNEATHPHIHLSKVIFDRVRHKSKQLRYDSLYWDSMQAFLHQYITIQCKHLTTTCQNYDSFFRQLNRIHTRTQAKHPEMY